MGETRMNRCIRPWREDDSGQTTILVVGLSAICILLATVITAATAVIIEARRLLSTMTSMVAASPRWPMVPPRRPPTASRWTWGRIRRGLPRS